METTLPTLTYRAAVVVARQFGGEGRTLLQRVAVVERGGVYPDGPESAVRVVDSSAKIVKWHRGSLAIRLLRLERAEHKLQVVQVVQWAVVRDRSTRVVMVEQETIQAVAAVAGMVVAVALRQWDKHGVAVVVVVRRMWPCLTNPIPS